MVNNTATLDAVFSALADPTRRKILEELTAGAANVTALAKPFRISLPAISKHLRVLEKAGLVVRTRLGRGPPNEGRSQTLAASRRLDDPLRTSLGRPICRHGTDFVGTG